MRAVLAGVPAGPPDLRDARLAVFAWMAARSRGLPLFLEGGPWRESLEWLGLDFDGEGEAPEPALRVAEAGRAAPAEPAILLGPLQGNEAGFLENRRSGGYIPEGLLAWLGELGWRNPEAHACLTRPELVLAFREEDLSPDPVPFDPERLEEVHRQFLEELTPAELVERSLPFWREAGLLEGGPTDTQIMDLEALALLYGPEVRVLPDFPRLVSFYLRDPQPVRHAGLAPLARALERVETWDSLPLEEVVLALDPETWEAAERALTGSAGTPGLAELMALVGREATLRRLRASAA